jgi:hypothetical protein
VVHEEFRGRLWVNFHCIAMQRSTFAIGQGVPRGHLTFASVHVLHTTKSCFSMLNVVDPSSCAVLPRDPLHAGVIWESCADMAQPAIRYYPKLDIAAMLEYGRWNRMRRLKNVDYMTNMAIYRKSPIKMGRMGGSIMPSQALYSVVYWPRSGA